jgi:hypothetical protein
MNPIVGTFFVANYPFWTIHSSPAAFSDTEKTSIVRAILKQVVNEDCYIFRHPRINLRSLGRFLTPAIEAELLTNLSSSTDLVRGNAMVVLSLRHQSDVLPLAVAVLKDRKLDVNLRKCAILAVTTAGGFDLVPDLMAFLDHDDPLYNEVLDCIGALCDESQISAVLPLLLTAGTILNASFYHFREFRSREALLQTLSYFGTRPHELNVIRADGYLEPMLRLICKYWDETTARQCVRIIKEIDEKKVYPDRSGIAYKLFRAVREADGNGFVARCFLEDILNSGKAEERRWFYVDQLIADLSTVETAQWLIDNHATALIQQLSPYLQGTVRELLRSHSDGWIDTQDENARAYAAERTEKENARKEEISLSQERLSQEQNFHKAINEFHELEESHWPELSTERKAWLATEVSKLLVALDLERSIVWKDETLTTPAVLSVLLKLIHRYELNVTPDTSLVYATVSWDEKIVAEYYRRWGLSSLALQILNSLLLNPKSPRALAGTVAFVRDSGIWSTSVQSGLMQVVQDPVENYYQIDAVHLLAGHGVDADFLKEIADGGASSQLRTTAFGFLIERQHRPTIQGALSKLLADESALRHGETGFPLETPLAWIAKIRSDFAIPRLADLRATALKFELPRVVGLLTTTLSKIDRSQSAQIIKRQIPLAPVGWRQAQQFIAVEEDRAAKIELIQRSPFEVILAKLKGATSIDRLKVWCEGPTDIPVFKSLLAQVPDTPEILFDFVAGWPNLQAKDPQSFQHGCKEAIVVMDGDRGRRLDKRTKPPTTLAKNQQRRFTGLPVELYVLERYGIENYFPQSSIEVVVGQSLGRYFPIPHHLSVVEYLRDDRGQSPWEHVKRYLAWRYGLRFKFAGQKLYNKNLNQKVSELLVLDKDLSGTDLGDIIQRIADRAKALAKDS